MRGSWTLGLAFDGDGSGFKKTGGMLTSTANPVELLALVFDVPPELEFLLLTAVLATGALSSVIPITLGKGSSSVDIL